MLHKLKLFFKKEKTFFPSLFSRNRKESQLSDIVTALTKTWRSCQKLNNGYLGCYFKKRFLINKHIVYVCVHICVRLFQMKANYKKADCCFTDAILIYLYTNKGSLSSISQHFYFIF